jgi:hypothetical protein
MATEESSLTDFEYRVVDRVALEGRVYNQHGQAVNAIIQSVPFRDRAALRQTDLEKSIQIRLVLRGEWKENIREVFGLE